MSDRLAVGERLGAVVVNHDAGETLLGCVASLRGAGVEHVVVVDNASSDGSLVALAQADPSVVIVPTGANLGYGSAANRGARRLSTEYLLVCNPDLLLDAAAAEELLDALSSQSDLGVCGPTILDPTGAVYPSARAFPSFKDAAGHAVVGLFRPDNRYTARYRMTDRQASDRTVVEVDWVSGACLALSAVAFFSVGGFDEGYFMYVEDLDLCWRLHRAGWKVGYVAGAEVVHQGGVSAARRPYRMLVAHHRSTWRFACKSIHGTKRAVLPFVAAGLVARLLVALVSTRRDLRRG